jgi:4-hydroxythreonine-4-phosphate dehydrogenase
MFMVAENIKVGLVTEHVTIAEVANHITKENIVRKLRIMNGTLKEDFV